MLHKFKLSEQDYGFDLRSCNAGVINVGPSFSAGVLLEQLCSVRDTVPSPRRKVFAIFRSERPCLLRSISRRSKIFFGRCGGRFRPDLLWTVTPTLPFARSC